MTNLANWLPLVLLCLLPSEAKMTSAHLFEICGPKLQSSQPWCLFVIFGAPFLLVVFQTILTLFLPFSPLPPSFPLPPLSPFSPFPLSILKTELIVYYYLLPPGFEFTILPSSGITDRHHHV